MGIADRDDVGHQCLNHRESQLPQKLGLRPVSDGAGCVNAHNMAQTLALLGVVAGLGFDPDHHAVRAVLLGRHGTARNQAAATEADQQQVQRAGVFQQLLGCRALTGHHMGMVVRRDQGHAPLLGQLAANRFAVFGITVVADDLGAVTPGGRHLDGGGVLRHHDRGRDT